MNTLSYFTVFAILASVIIAVQSKTNNINMYMAGPMAGLKTQKKFGDSVVTRMAKPSNGPSLRSSDCRNERKTLSNAKRTVIVTRAVLQARESHMERKAAQVNSLSRTYMRASAKAEEIHQEGEIVNSRIAADEATVAEINAIPRKTRSAEQRALQNKLVRRIRSLQVRVTKLKGQWKREENESTTAKNSLTNAEQLVSIAKKRAARTSRELRRAVVASSRAIRALKNCNLTH